MPEWLSRLLDDPESPPPSPFQKSWDVRYKEGYLIGKKWLVEVAYIVSWAVDIKNPKGG